MNYERAETNFAAGILHLARAVKAGALGIQNEDFRKWVREAPQSERVFPNPSEAEIIDYFLSYFPGKKISVSQLQLVPWSPKVIRKGAFLATWVAVSDQHDLPVDEQILVPDQARVFVNEVIGKSDNLGRQITILEQLDIAMKLSGNQLLAALLIAHSGSRAIARGSETRAGLVYEVDDLKKWQDCIAYFPQTEDGYGDPPGDTYHFWGQAAAGLLSLQIINCRDRIFNPLYEMIYPNTSFFVARLRRKCFDITDERFRHQAVDKMGFRIGKNLVKQLQSF